jgi:hypothetical protein
LFKIIHSTGAKGSTQTNQKNKLGLNRKELVKETEGCLGLAHRTVRCATRQCPVHQGESARTLHLRVSQAQHRYNSPDCPVPDSVRCTNGATTICVQRSTLTDEQYRGRSQSSGQRAPDCPVCVTLGFRRQTECEPCTCQDQQFTYTAVT